MPIYAGSILQQGLYFYKDVRTEVFYYLSAKSTGRIVPLKPVENILFYFKIYIYLSYNFQLEKKKVSHMNTQHQVANHC